MIHDVNIQNFMALICYKGNKGNFFLINGLRSVALCLSDE